MTRKLSSNKAALQASYEASERANALLRAALKDAVNGIIRWHPIRKDHTDGTTHRYGWGRLDSASGGYLIYSFGAPGQSNFVRLEYLDDAAVPKRLSRASDRFRADAIMAAKSARDRVFASSPVKPLPAPF